MMVRSAMLNSPDAYKHCQEHINAKVMCSSYNSFTSSKS